MNFPAFITTASVGSESVGWLFNLMLAGQPWLQFEDCEDVVEVPIGLNWIKMDQT